LPRGEKRKKRRTILKKSINASYPWIESIRRRLEGKRVFICGGTGRSFAAAALIDDFGHEAVGLGDSYL